MNAASKTRALLAWIASDLGRPEHKPPDDESAT